MFLEYLQVTATMHGIHDILGHNTSMPLWQFTIGAAIAIISVIDYIIIF